MPTLAAGLSGACFAKRLRVGRENVCGAADDGLHFSDALQKLIDAYSASAMTAADACSNSPASLQNRGFSGLTGSFNADHYRRKVDGMDRMLRP